MIQEVIKLENIKRYFKIGDVEVQALRGIDLIINKGEYVALMGPSGSGKSTLMNLLGCLDTPSAGKYWLSGQDVSQMDDDELAKIRNKEIGFVFQTFNLLPRSNALDNVALPLVYAGYSRTERNERALKTLESVGLADRTDHKPNELSGGQRQRVAIARALINNPAIILADEPSGNLDSANAKQLHELFFELRNEMNQTFVIVTHNNELADMADRKLTIKDGII
jgi:putative ABC transport system ATP-binding protein